MWFKKRSDGGLSPDELDRMRQASDARAEETLAALQRGQLPPPVRERLAREKRAELPWTSTLSVNEWLVFSGLGLKPLGLVMGSCFYHVGYSLSSYGGSWFSRDLSDQERAITEGRRIALSRMEQEAVELGAHAIVAVRMDTRQPGYYGHETEFVAMGTAVKLDGVPPNSRPLVCTVDGEDFLKLLRIGSIPVGVALGACVHYQYTSAQDKFQSMNFWNMEVPRYTDAIYHTRDRAVRSMWDDARQMGASGVLAHDTELRVMEVEVERGEGDEREDHIVEFLSIGTAVSSVHTPPELKVKPVLELHDWLE